MQTRSQAAKKKEVILSSSEEDIAISTTAATPRKTRTISVQSNSSSEDDDVAHSSSNSDDDDVRTPASSKRRVMQSVSSEESSDSDTAAFKTPLKNRNSRPYSGNSATQTPRRRASSRSAKLAASRRKRRRVAIKYNTTLSSSSSDDEEDDNTHRRHKKHHYLERREAIVDKGYTPTKFVSQSNRYNYEDPSVDHLDDSDISFIASDDDQSSAEEEENVVVPPVKSHTLSLRKKKRIVFKQPKISPDATNYLPSSEDEDTNVIINATTETDDVVYDVVDCVCKRNTITSGANVIWLKCRNDVCEKWQHARCVGYKSLCQRLLLTMREGGDDDDEEHEIYDECLKLKKKFYCSYCRPAEFKARMKASTPQKKRLRKDNSTSTKDILLHLENDDAQFFYNREITASYVVDAFTNTTVLMEAAKVGATNVVSKLLENADDADITTLNNDFQNALFFASSASIFRQILLCKDSSTLLLMTADAYNNTVVHHIIMTSRQMMEEEQRAAWEYLVIELIEEYSIKYTSGEGGKSFLSLAVNAQLLALVKSIVKKFGSNRIVDDTDDDGVVPLMEAASGCNNEILAYFLSQNIYKNISSIKDRDGMSAIHYAARVGNADALKLLLSKTKNVERAVNAYTISTNVTPLHLAAAASESNSFECIKILLENNSDALAADEFGWIPLLYADFTSSCKSNKSVMALLDFDFESQLRVLVTMVEEKKYYDQVISIFERLALTPDYFELLNKFISQNSFVLQELDFLAANRYLLNFENKKRLFDTLIGNCRKHERILAIKGVPQSAWFCMTKWMSFVPFDALKSHVSASKYGNDLSSGPGVTREFWEHVVKCLTSRNTTSSHCQQLFYKEEEYLLPINKREDNDFRLAGRFYAHLILYSYNVNWRLHPSFLKKVLQMEVSLETEDPLRFKMLNSVLKYEGNIEEDLALEFSDVDPFTGKLVKLGKDDRDHHHHGTSVTNENVEEYVGVMTEYRMSIFGTDSVVSAFRDGILDIIDDFPLLSLFKPDELNLLVNGTESDVITDKVIQDLMERQTVYGGEFSSKHVVVKWFWKLFKSLSSNERELMIKFVTGSSRVQQNNSRIAALTITSSYQRPDSLPTAFTCFNQLQLPLYPDYETLRFKVLAAIRHGSEGFVFG